MNHCNTHKHTKIKQTKCLVVLAESVADIDKVLLGLEGKHFTVEASTLQSLQQLMQFIADLSLNILARLPESRSMSGSGGGGGATNRNTGVRMALPTTDIFRCATIKSKTFIFDFQYEISKDIIALNSIRELLVIMRIWGLLNRQCLPVFSRSAESIDILVVLFKLLTRLALNPNEPDDLLLGK